MATATQLAPTDPFEAVLLCDVSQSATFNAYNAAGGPDAAHILLPLFGVPLIDYYLQLVKDVNGL